MLRINLMISLFILALVGLFAPKTSFHPSVVLIGGEYTVQPGETRSGDLLLLFARVKVTESGQVTGNIQLFGSTLEVAGRVAGYIQAYGSEINLEAAARVEGAINTLGSWHGLPQFPSILMVIS